MNWWTRWRYSEAAATWSSVVRLVVVCGLARFDRWPVHSWNMTVILLTLVAVGDLLWCCRGEVRVLLRGTSVYVVSLILVYCVVSHEFDFGRWVARNLCMSRGYLAAGRYWAPITAQGIHRNLRFLVANIIPFLALGVRIECEAGRRHFLGLVTVAALCVGYSAMLASPHARIIGPEINVCLATALLVLLFTRSGCYYSYSSIPAVAILTTILTQNATGLAIFALDNCRGEPGITAVLALASGLAGAGFYRYRQRTRTQRLLDEFLARKRERGRRRRQLAR